MSYYASRSAYEFTESPKKVTPAPTPHSPVVKQAAVSSFFSNKWTSFTAKAQEVAERAKSALSEIVQSDHPTPSDDHYKSQDIAWAPWENLGLQDPEIEKEVTQLILDLPKNSRHFLNAPPEDSLFPFKLEEWLPVSIAALRQDEALRELRYKLVPAEIDEDSFWRNYFFRVNMLKRAYGIPEVPQYKPKIDSTDTSSKQDELVGSLNTKTEINSEALDVAKDQQNQNHTEISDPSNDDQEQIEPMMDFYDLGDPSTWNVDHVVTPTPMPPGLSDEILRALDD